MNAMSEDELIAAIRRLFSGEAPGVKVGIGDDAAVLDAGSGDLVISADSMVEDVHFARSDMRVADLGYKAIVSAVSDLAAMAASPRYALVSLVLPTPVESGWVVELFGGMRDACEEYALSLVGGDLSRGDKVVIAVTVTGATAPGRAVLRSGARAGDRIVVTGRLGASAAGRAMLEAGFPKDVVQEQWRALVQAFCRPVARVGEARVLASRGANSMMDLSDGLAKDLTRLCAASDAGARLSLADVPVAEGSSLELALGGGEDYELIATLPADVVAGAAAELKERFGVELTDIGEIVESGESGAVMSVDAGGDEKPLEPSGWDHFA